MATKSTKSPIDKRTRLVDTAAKLVHEQGFNRTKLADISRESASPTTVRKIGSSDTRSGTHE